MTTEAEIKRVRRFTRKQFDVLKLLVDGKWKDREQIMAGCSVVHILVRDGFAEKGLHPDRPGVHWRITDKGRDVLFGVMPSRVVDLKPNR